MGPTAAPPEWSLADRYARNYVLRELMDMADELERKNVGGNVAVLVAQRAYAVRAAIMRLSREAT